MTTNRGQAVLEACIAGSALGRPCAGMRRGHLRQLLGGPMEQYLSDPVLFPDKPDRNCLPGLHGLTAQLIIAASGLFEAHTGVASPVTAVAQRILDFAKPDDAEREGFGLLRNAGKPLRESIERWRTEYPWDEKDYFSSSQASEGIGAAAMALAPVALGVENSTGVAARLARLTHFRLLPVSAAVCVAKAGELLLQDGGKKIDAQRILKETLTVVEQFEGVYTAEHQEEWEELGWDEQPARLSTSLLPLGTLLREQNEDLAVATILKTAQEISPDRAVTHPQHGYAGASIPWLLFLALGPTSPRNAIENVLNRGGETEVLASLLAGLFVCRYGRDFLPDEWYEGALGVRSLNQCPIGEENFFHHWIVNEQAWNAREESLRAPLRKALSRQEKEDAASGKASKKKSQTDNGEDQNNDQFAPPPHLWMKPGEEEDPAKKRILKEARGKRRIDWKEDRRKGNREKD